MASASRIPLGVKIGFTLFMAVLLPVYTRSYGLLNFLWFCDLAMLFTLAGILMESPRLISGASAGIILPQVLWLVDFAVECTGHHFTGLTGYMFEPDRAFYLKLLSSFHGWLPFLLLYLLSRLGYDRRGWMIWTATAWAACILSWFLIPGPTTQPLAVKNVNMVYGPSETVEQTWAHPVVFLVGWMIALAGIIYWPTHLLLTRCFPSRHV